MKKRPADQPTTDSDRVLAAKRMFVAKLLDLSWKLAGAFLVPVFIGAGIDGVRDGDSKRFVIIGLVIGFIAAILVIVAMAKDNGVIR